AGIDQGLEIRPGTLTLYRVGGLLVSTVEAHARERRQLTARRKPHHPDARRIDVPFSRAAADESNGAPRVGQRVVVHGISRVGLAREAIFEHEGGDAARAQETGDIMTFVVSP